jgi:pilus assembly protein CpaC
VNPDGLRVTPFASESGWGPAISEFAPSDATIQNRGMFLTSVAGNFLFDLVIDAAKDKGLAKVLAEPNLTTLSGQEAKFLAGGEFPVPVAQEDATTIEYKEYGVGLNFLPVVLDSGVISIKVNVTVSDLSNTNAVVLSTIGASDTVNVVPSLTKRQANSTVEVRTGETIAIAGLINDTLRENVDKFPGLGDVPVLGMLFRSQEFIKNQTELMIFVTPRLARSFDPQLVRLPTDSFVEPNDLEFYLMGRTEGRKYQGGTGHSTGGGFGPDQSGSEGPFGHDL